MHLPRQIRTERLVLREPRPDDAQPLFDGGLGSAEVLRHVGFTPHADAQQTQQMLSLAWQHWLKGSSWLWVVAQPRPQWPDGLAVGQIGLSPMSLPSAQTHHLRLGYVLSREQWGQGLMREAVRGLLSAVWPAAPTVWRIDALCDVDNPASARVLEAAGLVREGRMARAVLHPNASPQPRDAWLYAACRA